MPDCCILSWLAAPIRWIMSKLTQKSHVTTHQSGDVAQSITNDVLGIQDDHRDHWWVESKLWQQFYRRFGFEICGQVHMNIHEPYYTTTCDKGSRLWPNSMPPCLKSLYKVRLLFLNVTNPHGVLEQTYDSEGNVIKRPLLHVTNSPKRSAKKYHFCLESRLKEVNHRIAVPWEPKSRSNAFSTSQTRTSIQERYLVVAYSKTIAIILEVSHIGSQVLHVVNLSAELYHGNIPIRGYMHSYISPDEKMLVIGDCLANGELVWSVLKIRGDKLSTVGNLRGQSNISQWCVYSALTFEPNVRKNYFIAGGRCIQLNGGRVSNALCSFEIDEGDHLQPGISKFICFTLCHISHSPNGPLCIVLNQDQRQIHIYHTQTLDELQVISERSIPYPLPKKEVFQFPKLHLSMNQDPGHPLMFKMFKCVSGCNLVRVSRGGAFLCVSTCDSSDPNKIIRYIILRLPLTELLSLKEFCKRTILQCVLPEERDKLPLPNEIQTYIFL